MTRNDEWLARYTVGQLAIAHLRTLVATFGIHERKLRTNEEHLQIIENAKERNFRLQQIEEWIEELCE